MISEPVREQHKNGKNRARALAVLLALTVIAGAFAVGCGRVRPGGHTALPEETEHAFETRIPEPTEDPGETASSTPHVTKGPELPVTPLPDTPGDPLNPANYPLSPNLDAKLKELLDAYGYSIQGIFNAIEKPKRGYPHFYYDNEDRLDTLPGYMELAEYILNEGHGVCYHYAALTCYLLRAAGYEACVIYGYRTADAALHYWTMVKTEKGWYHFDPLHHQMLFTDEQKSSPYYTGGNDLVWQQGVWPETPKEFY